MCCNTKQKIADTVEELLCTQPGGRVTVQQVMELTRMNRQSFYYHYQDINDVLRTIVTRKVCVPLRFDPEETPETWCRRGLTLLKEQRPLLRRISRELGDDQVWALLFLEIRPQVDRLLPVRNGQDPVQREMAVDAISRSVLLSVAGLILRGESVNVDASMEKFRAVFSVLDVA